MFVFLPYMLVLSEKAYVTLCFSLKVGRSEMACFRLLCVFVLLRIGYDTEIICVYATEPVLLYFFFYCLIL